MPPTADFAAHRRLLLDRLAPDEAVLLFGAAHHVRNGDSEYKYRPDSDVYWLTGWEDPECAVFLRPGDEPFTLFVQPRDKEREVWTGYRAGPEGAREKFGADAAHPIGALEEHLPRLIQGVNTLHYAFGADHATDLVVLGAIRAGAKAARKNGLDVPETFHAPSKLLHELRLHKTPDELAVLREAAKLTARAHRAAMQKGRPGVGEHEIEALIDYTFRSGGGNGPGYTTIVAGGKNATVLHYVTNSEPLADGDLLLIDAGCEVSYYTADVTRTFPVGGRFSPAQRKVYEHVLAAQLAAIGTIKPGTPFKTVHDTTVRRLTEGMVALGLLKGEVDALIASEAYKKYYMHGTSHWLGLDVHDAGLYARKGKSRPLEAGMVLTVEPGLYIAADDETAPPELRGIGVRIEDDVLVTAGGHEVLTAEIPKTVDEVEAACQG
jgi:Xaa-Pro aminopeptidase